MPFLHAFSAIYFVFEVPMLVDKSKCFKNMIQCIKRMRKRCVATRLKISPNIVMVVLSSTCLCMYKTVYQHSTVNGNQVNRRVNRRHTKSGGPQQERNKRQLLLRLTSVQSFH